jgi:hypothetical protein
MVLTLVVNLVLFLIPAGVASLLSRVLARSSREEWQLLAWVPVLPLLIWGVLLAVAVTRDPTSHNLWPFELVFWALLSGALFAAVLIGRWLAARNARRGTFPAGRGRTMSKR